MNYLQKFLLLLGVHCNPRELSHLQYASCISQNFISDVEKLGYSLAFVPTSTNIFFYTFGVHMLMTYVNVLSYVTLNTHNFLHYVIENYKFT